VLANTAFLGGLPGVAVHADLIFGLPGETLESFAAGFDRLVLTCDPPELQVNLLKGLPGTPLALQAAALGLCFNPAPPYELLFSDTLDFAALCRLQRFARCWELVHNRGRFTHAARRLREGAGVSPYARYQALADRIHADHGRLHAIGHPTLARHLAAALVADCGLSPDEAEALVRAG